MTPVFLRVLNHFWRWYLIQRPAVILHAWRNFLVFGLNFFSIFFLLRTLVAPFHLYSESYGRGFDLQQWLVAAFSNLIFRILGMMVRLVIIVAGIAFELICLAVGLVIFVGWFVLPLAALLAIIIGINLLIS